MESSAIMIIDADENEEKDKSKERRKKRKLTRIDEDRIVRNDPFLRENQEKYWITIIELLIPQLPATIVECIVDFNVLRVRLHDLVDVRDTNFTWYPALVIGTVGDDHVNIHYFSWDRKYDETLHSSSENLAPFRYHTRPIACVLDKHYLTRELNRTRETHDAEWIYYLCEKPFLDHIWSELHKPTEWTDDEEPWTPEWHTTHTECHSKCTL